MSNGARSSTQRHLFWCTQLANYTPTPMHVRVRVHARTRTHVRVRTTLCNLSLQRTHTRTHARTHGYMCLQLFTV